MVAKSEEIGRKVCCGPSLSSGRLAKESLSGGQRSVRVELRRRKKWQQTRSERERQAEQEEQEEQEEEKEKSRGREGRVAA